MKKIYSFFFVILLLIITKSYANRDDVSNMIYGTNIIAPYTIQVTTKNTACNTKKTYEAKDIFSLLNISGINGVNCYKASSSKIVCTKNISNGPIKPIIEKFKIYATNQEILSTLGVPKKIRKNISGNYVQEFSAKMNLLVDSNGKLTPSWDTDFEFSDIANPFSLFGNGNTIEYSDESECNDCTKTTTGTGATGDTCSGEGENRTCTTNTCSPINTKIPTPLNIDLPPFDNNITPPTIDFIDINGCEKTKVNGWDQFICYANSKLDFEVKLKTLGTGYKPKGIENLNLSINNWENNAPASPTKKEKVNIQDSGNHNISFASEKFTTKGKYTLVFQGEGKGDNPSTFSPLKNIKLIIIANNNYTPDGGPEVSGDPFANNSDKIRICQNITDSYGNKFGKDYGELLSNFVDIKEGIFLNNVQKNGGEALFVSNISFRNSQICFDIKSKTPDEKKITIDLLIPKHSQQEDSTLLSSSSSLIINPRIAFKKPFVGLLKASKDEGKTWEASPEIGTNMDYKLELIRKSSINVNPNLNNFKGSVQAQNTENHTVENVSSPSPILNLLQIENGISFILSPQFSLRINTSKQAKTLVKNPSIILNPCPIISYEIGGKNISYYLSAKEDDFDNNDFIQLGGIDDFKGVKIIGTSQSSGKYTITGQKDNFSDLYKSKLREAIKKNAYELIKGMKNGQIIKKVKYSEGDITISGENLGYETLIVKNGNVIIDNNLNKNGKTLGIIVLKDNYNSKIDFNTSGNIYITPQVTYINALIYADGGFISTDNTGKVYTSDSSKRTSNLQNQLTLKGSLFTRNTIGGAILSGGDYKLPGGEKTTDFNLAMVYDLNYVRRGNKGCIDNNTNGKCDTFDNPFIIEYNPDIQKNPPVGF